MTPNEIEQEIPHPVSVCAECGLPFESQRIGPADEAEAVCPDCCEQDY